MQLWRGAAGGAGGLLRDLNCAIFKFIGSLKTIFGSSHWQINIFREKGNPAVLKLFLYLHDKNSEFMMNSW